MADIIFHVLKDHKFHLSKAKRNERFYRKHDLDTSTFNEWAVVVLFYASLHYVDAVLSQDTSLSDELRDPVNHIKRKEAISRCDNLLPIARYYLELYDRSIDARYRHTSFPEGSLHNIKTSLFEPVQSHLRKCLGVSAEAQS